MPESPGLYLRLSVTENLACFADLYEVPDTRDRIDRALQAVQLADRAHDAAARCPRDCASGSPWPGRLLPDPQVLFLDEPTSGLDPVAARDVHDLIDDLRQRGVTIFLTTHRLEEAERLCDRVAILNTTLRTIGKPSELRDQLFARTLAVRNRRPAHRPALRLRRPAGREGWHHDGPAAYVLAVSDPAVAAPASPALWWQPAPTCCRSASRATRSRTSTWSWSARTRRRAADEREQEARPGHLRQGAPRIPAQRQHHRRHGHLPADLPHPAAAHGPDPGRVGIQWTRTGSMFCCTCWLSRRSCPQRSPPTPWSASVSRALWSPCSRRRSAARSSCWARRWRRSSRRSPSRMRSSRSSSPASSCSHIRA